MKKSAFKDNRGLTLVELMVGVTILAIIVVPLLHTFVVGAATEARSRTYGNATQAAQNLIEQIQATDPDLILNNATMVATGATYYTYNGTEYSPIDPATTKALTISSLPKAYYIGIPNYTYGGSAFDALITLEVQNESANSNDVVIGNQMDALLNMSQADANAEMELKTQCGEMVAKPDQELTVSLLTRSITLNVSRSGTSSPYTYEIDAVFDYSATIPYKVDNVNYVYPFKYTEQSSASVASIADSTDGSPVLSAFLFFDGYYRSNMSNETIDINNPTGSDINFFLVNTNTGAMPPTYGAQVSYKYQNFNAAGNPVNNLFFTNTPTNVSYIAYEDSITSETYTTNTTPAVSQYLVETKALSRKFNVIINLYNTGSNFTGTPILTIDSTRLNY